MNVQQYIADKYRKHLEETVGQGYDAIIPDEFVESFDIQDLSSEDWFFKDPFKKLEDYHDKVYGAIDYRRIHYVIDGLAMIAIMEVDLGHLYDIASDYADERN